MAVAQEHWAAKWIAASDGNVPPNSFWEGDHAIGRAYFKDGLHVGYVKQGRGLIIGWGGKEHLITHYEVLTGDKSHFHWVLCKGACRPHNFIPLKGGFESDGKELYIGRVHYNGKDRIGKAGQHLIDGMNFAVDGREMSCPEYYVFAFRT